MFKNLLKSIVVILVMMTIGYNAYSQKLTDMTVSITDPGYSVMSGGTYIGAGDDNVYGVYFPFNFSYDTKSYVANSDIFYVSCNGYITFPPHYNYSAYYASPLNIMYACVTAFRGDLYCYGSIYAGVTGSAPNRVLIIQWSNIDFYYSYSANMNFQIKLYETSNKVEITYGSMAYGSYSYWNHYCGFVGIDGTRYINVKPGATYTTSFSSVNAGAPDYTNATLTSASVPYITNGKSIALTAFPTLVGSYPTAGTILRRGNVYTGAQHPALLFNRITGQADVYAKYKISGPLPADPAKNKNFKTIYTGTNLAPSDEQIYFNPQPVGTGVSVNIPYAKGIAAGANGDLDLSTNQGSIIGGQYIVESQMILPTFSYIQVLDAQTFVIALDYDLAITALSSPKPKNDKRYPLSIQIPVQCTVTNLGLTGYSQFTAKAVITSGADTIYQDTKVWPTTPPATLNTGDAYQVNFANFRPRLVGDYKLALSVTPNSPVQDDEWANNVFPRDPDEYYFTIAHEIEAEAIDVIVPGDTVYVGRPVLPKGRFRNNGVSDISDIPASIYIVKMSPPYDTVYRDNIIIQDIPSGKYNTTDALYGSNFIPPSAGQYKACINVNSADDPITTNNSYCKLFNVVNAMAGTYTIGTLNNGGARNFTLINDALNALYLKGVTGPVTFEFTDANYVTGDINLQYPAIELSGKIIGVDSVNTITFKPSQDRSLTRGGVTIQMNSGAGIGVYIAQNTDPYNSWAAVLNVTTSLKKRYARTEGYITFDGGSQKAMRLTLNTNGKFRAAVYLGNGAANCNVKNLLIENVGGNFYEENLAMSKYDVAQSQFAFEPNTRTDGTSYTAGILMRSIAPRDKNENTNTFRLDTMVNTKNVISGNVVQGFAFGIASMGIGPLFYDAVPARYQRYYNYGNLISNNEIYNVSKAAIFLGHEENTTVKNNVIYTVNGAKGGEVAGIWAGGMTANGNYGYNNINLSILSNEISGVSSALFTSGIKVEQCRNSYPFSNPSFIVFPNTAENTKIANNSIWKLKTTTAVASKIGINMLTERSTNANWFTQYTTAKIPAYFTSGDEIINNTIIMSSDNNGIATTGAIAGIAVQQSNGTKLQNNAIAVTDEETDPNNPINAGVFYQGVLPKTSGFTSDRNVFQTNATSNASFYHFFEISSTGTIIDSPARTDYQSISQWQNWTGQDMNSVVGNFMSDLVYLGTEPNQQLRVVSNPTPMGSLLNNRGNRISWVTNDIDGNLRGAAGQRYDIGAVEFTGRNYLTDVETLVITQPAAYRAGSGLFSDAEYIMTTAPIEIKGLVRNNGTLPLTGVTAHVYCYRELPNGLYSTTPELTTTQTFNVASTESFEIPFKLADGQGLEFTPKTYGDLRGQGYVVPDQFTTMEANVTPKYKIEIAIDADQNNSNNRMTKITRFYIRKSVLRMIVSSENSNKTITGTSTPDEIAGKLNYTKLIAALGTIGWKVDISKSIYHFDIFEKNGWEPRAVNYNNYRTMFWGDANDKSSSRYQRLNIYDFLSQGSQIEKKNLIIGSQEMVRQHAPTGPTPDAYLTQTILRSNLAAPGNPKGANVSNDSNYAVGISIGRNVAELIVKTGTTNDPAPYCGLLALNTTGEGLATPAFYYQNHSAAPNDSLVGITTSTLTRNVCFFAVDWRHWNRLDMIIRGSIDYIEKNGGTVIPVELTNFEAIARGNKVDLSWTTASEYNSDRFEVERAIKSQAGENMFVKVAEQKAAGTSSFEKNYGPIVDKDLQFGETYIYRLRSIDLNGENSLSAPKEVKIGGENTTWLGASVPNPISNDAEFSFNVSESGNVDINLYDMSGKLVKNLFTGSVNSGINTVKYNVSELTSGTYNYILKFGNNQFVQQIKVVK